MANIYLPTYKVVYFNYILLKCCLLNSRLNFLKLGVIKKLLLFKESEL